MAERGGNMIKGVNKMIVEINNTESEYFDKAILFVSPQMQHLPNKIINKEGKAFINKFGAVKSNSTLSTAIKLISAAGLGAIAMALIALL